MKVKICGVCRPEDAAAAVRAGADYVGIIFAPSSRRRQHVDDAARIYVQAGSTKRVGVFADQSEEVVLHIADALHLDVIQLHGHEDPQLVARIAQESGREVWKSVWLQSSADLPRALANYEQHVHGLLLDAAADAGRGGTGTRFDWRLAAHAREQIPSHLALIVAGGLRPENVRPAIEAMRPDVVDVASGVERVICEKSAVALQAFVRNAKL